MEQYNEVVFKHREGYKHVVSNAENGDLIVKSVPIMLEEGDVDKAKYFVKVSEEDRKRVAEWFGKQKEEEISRKSAFLYDVKQALEKIDYDFWIACLEPSVKDGKIYYKEGEEVGVGFDCEQWKKMAEEYYRERGSRMGQKIESAMWYALRIVNKSWTLQYVGEDSSGAGNYHNNPDSSGTMEKTGARVCGGYKDGQGNSYRIVTINDYAYALLGGDFYDDGRKRPVADSISGFEPPEAEKWGAAVVVLTKP